jgi:hypothetical protein
MTERFPSRRAFYTALCVINLLVWTASILIGDMPNMVLAATMFAWCYFWRRQTTEAA